MERDYHYPTFADRDPPITWRENGRPDAWGRAREEAKRVLNEYHPEYLASDIEEKVRSAFNILL